MIKKFVGKLIVCNKWKFYGGALWVVWRQRVLGSLLMSHYFFSSSAVFLKKQNADLDVEKDQSCRCCRRHVVYIKFVIVGGNFGI